VSRRLERAGEPAVIILIVCAVLLPVSALLMSHDVRGLAINLFVDDTFYYLKIARNAAEGYGSTFDYVHPTNGYHPLWFLTLVPLMAVSSKLGAIHLVLFVQALLVLFGGVFGATALRREGISPRASAVAFALCVGFGPLLSKAMLSGMEGPLFWFLFNASLLAATRVRPDAPTPRLLWLGVLAGLACLARLDTYPICAAIGLGWTLRCHRAGRWSRWWRIVFIAGPIGALMALYVSSNLALFGIPITVSSMTKMGLTGSVEPKHVALLLVLAVPILALVRPALRRRGPGLAAVMAAATPLGIVGMNTIVAPREVFRIWFFLPEIFAGWLIGAWALNRLVFSRPSRALHRAVLTLGGLAVLVNAALAVRWTAPERFVQWQTQLAFGERIAAEFGGDAVVLAGFDVGRVAYFVDPPVVNLDGLANGTEFIGACEEGRMLEYLLEKDIDYVFNYAFNGLSLVDARLRPCAPDAAWETHTELVWREVVEIPRLGASLNYDLVRIKR